MIDLAIRRLLDPLGILQAVNAFVDGVIGTYRMMSREREAGVDAEIHCPCGTVWVYAVEGGVRACCPGCAGIGSKKVAL